ncbi:MAG: sigma 54-dependent Fis family transcriptional regulator, partial [Deltaproteobacteria bacterium]|nr:sigma 54-dependent Fis family transcriptional regulator [Deltaproteobacteria bacterium]
DRGLAKTFNAPSIVIGRANADLQLDDRRVSALHAELRLEPDGFRLRDLGSTNGTLISGVRIVEAFLTPNAVIALGDTTIQFTPLDASFELPLASADRLEGFIGGGIAMRRMYELIARYAGTDATVLITGETGSGKEVAAEAIHLRSRRRSGPFIVLDCGAIPAQLVEDQLFGHEAGAFTGAGAARPGVFEAAHGGTLFLDEIGELPIEVQPKLLRAVETKTVTRLGSTEPRKCDVRIVAATNRDLASEVNRDRFRADLYFRLAVARIHVPPLREHREDLDALVEHFVAKLACGPLPPEFRAWAHKHPWPGNVRELRAAVEQSIVFARHPELAPIWNAPPASGALEIDVSLPFKETKRKLLDELERRYIVELLDAHGGNVSAAARAADLDRMTIYKMLRRAGLRDPE